MSVLCPVSRVAYLGGKQVNVSNGCRSTGKAGDDDPVENRRKTANSRLMGPIEALASMVHGTERRSIGKQKENKKGFVITIDAIAALSFMLLSLYFIQSMSFNPVILKGSQLKQLSLDTISVLEKSGRLVDVVEGNSTAAREILLATPEAVCMQLSVAAENKTVIATIDKPACGGIGSEVQISYGIFRAYDELYSVTLRSWYRQEAID